MQYIKDQDIMLLINKILDNMDGRVVRHAQRVAFIADCILCGDKTTTPQQRILQCILSLLHNIGAFKTEEIDDSTNFEHKKISDHALHGYLFLKHLSPLDAYASCILYHHTPAHKLPEDFALKKETSLLYIANHIEQAISHGKPVNQQFFDDFPKGSFLQCYVDSFLKQNLHHHIELTIHNHRYLQSLQELYAKMHFDPITKAQYLKMMALVVDFHSSFTVIHTITTQCISVLLGELMNCSKEDIEKLSIGSLLHDVGKVATPVYILEKRGKLQEREMKFMRQHVVISEEILRDFLPQDILQIAVRHHEKLDGSGYPYGLVEADLSLCEQIVAVADIYSALLEKRSYKEKMPSNQVLQIMRELAEKGEINPCLVDELIKHEDYITEETTQASNAILQIYENMKRDWIRIAPQLEKSFHPEEIVHENR